MAAFLRVARNSVEYDRVPAGRPAHGRGRADPLDGRARGAQISLEHVGKRYPGSKAGAVTDLSLAVEAGELCVLVGPSGCGKTTTLRMINRLIPLDAGVIRIDGRDTLELEVTELRRRIGYVIQEGGLFPHMTVAGNIGTVPRLLGWGRRRIAARVSELLDLVGLEAALAGRYPAELSGGQKQRVGLARALAADPPLLLMDEPFNALDPVVREHLQDELLKLHRDLGKTIVFVTHDIDEAIKMGDRIAILRQGGILAQYDTPDAVLASPADEHVLRFVGENRALRRLALRRLGEIELARAPRDGSDLPVAAVSATVREALSLMVGANKEALIVTGDGDLPIGLLRLDQAMRLLE